MYLCRVLGKRRKYSFLKEIQSSNEYWHLIFAQVESEVTIKPLAGTALWYTARPYTISIRYVATLCVRRYVSHLLTSQSSLLVEIVKWYTRLHSRRVHAVLLLASWHNVTQRISWRTSAWVTRCTQWQIHEFMDHYKRTSADFSSSFFLEWLSRAQTWNSNRKSQICFHSHIM